MRTINKLALVALIGSLAGYGIYKAHAGSFTFNSPQTISHTGQGTAYEGSGSTKLNTAIRRATENALANLSDYCEEVKASADCCEASYDMGGDLDEGSVTYEVLKREAMSGGGVKVTVKATGTCYCKCYEP